MESSHGYGRLWYHSKRIFKRLSQGNVHHIFRVIKHSNGKNHFIVYGRNRSGRVFSSTDKSPQASQVLFKSDEELLVVPGEETKGSYTRQQVAHADTARRPMAVEGQPLKSKLLRVLSHR